MIGRAIQTDLDSHKARKWNVGICCIDSLRTFRLQAGVWLAGDCVRVSYNRSPHQLIAGGPHVLPSQYGPVGPALLANGRQSVVGRWPIDVCSTGWSPHRHQATMRGTGCSWVRRDCPLRTACPPAFFIIPSALLAISFFSLSITHMHTHTHTAWIAMCACYVVLYGADAVTPLRGPPPFRAPYIHIRDTSLARACIEPPPRENSATRVFYSNFRSAYLNPAPFFLSLFVREWLSRRLFCVSLPDTRLCARLPVTRMYMCERIEGRHYYPPPVPLLNFILPPFASTYGARSERNGRVACHSIAHARREPTYTRVRVLVGALLSPSPCAPATDSH